MPKKPGTNPKGELAFFNVVYEDGSQRSNRRVPAELLGGVDGDEPARGYILEQDREIAEKSGRLSLAIKSISRVGQEEIGCHQPITRFIWLSPPKSATLLGALGRRSVMNGNIFNSKGIHVGVIMDNEIFGLKGQKLYDLKGSNIYKLNGDLIGHLPEARGEKKRLDKATDRLFQEG